MQEPEVLAPKRIQRHLRKNSFADPGQVLKAGCMLALYSYDLRSSIRLPFPSSANIEPPLGGQNRILIAGGETYYVYERCTNYTKQIPVLLKKAQTKRGFLHAL